MISKFALPYDSISGFYLTIQYQAFIGNIDLGSILGSISLPCPTIQYQAFPLATLDLGSISLLVLQFNIRLYLQLLDLWFISCKWFGGWRLRYCFIWVGAYCGGSLDQVRGGKIEAENTIKMPANAIFPTNYENPQVENYKCPLLLFYTAIAGIYSSQLVDFRS